MSRIPIRYLPWMLRDLLLAQGVVLLAVAILIYVITIQISPTPPPSIGPAWVEDIVFKSNWIFILICTASVVSTDRSLGYYRSIFSRPVSPSMYYLQRWLMGALLIALITPVFTLAFSLALGSFPIQWSLVGQLEMFYLLLGGLVFLVSTVLRADWLLAFMIYMLQSMLFSFHSSPNFQLPGFWDFLYRILPPFHLVSVNTLPLTGPRLAHVLLYGAGLVLAALAVLRWRPLGAGGRA
jgi:hypothetical protein